MRLLILTVLMHPLWSGHGIALPGNCDNSIENDYIEGVDETYLPLMEITMPKEGILESFFTRSYANFSSHLQFLVNPKGRVDKMVNIFGNCGIQESLVSKGSFQHLSYSVHDRGIDNESLCINASPKYPPLTHIVMKVNDPFGVIWGCLNKNSSHREVGVFFLVNLKNYSDFYFETDLSKEIQKLLDFDSVVISHLVKSTISETLEMNLGDDVDYSMIYRCHCDVVCCGNAPKRSGVKTDITIIYVVLVILVLIFTLILYKIWN